MLKTILIYVGIELTLLTVFVVGALQANALLMAATLVLMAVTAELFHMEIKNR